MQKLIRFLSLIITVLLAQPAHADEVEVARQSVVRIIAVGESEYGQQGGTGTGFAISSRRVVTNAHVVRIAWESTGRSGVGIVPPNQKKLLRATIIAYDPDKDLALLEVQEGSFRPLSLYGGAFREGSDIIALGYPGNVDDVVDADLISPQPSMRSSGNYSNTSSVRGIEVLLHTAGIAHGNSGGPLMDKCGRILGVNTFVTNNDRGDASFGFAISTNELRGFLKREGQKFASVENECVPPEVAASRAAAARAKSDLAEAKADLLDARQREVYDKKHLARLQTQRENHMAIAGLAAVLAVLAGVFALVQHGKGQVGQAKIMGILAILSLVGAGYAFVSRPSLVAEVPLPAKDDGSGTVNSSNEKSKEGQRPELGKLALAKGKALRCTIDEGRSDYSTTDPIPVEMTMASDGCVNGRTQYAPSGDGAWQRVSVPKTEDVVTRLTYDPQTKTYTQERWIAEFEIIEAARKIKEKSPGQSCGMSKSGRDLLSKTQRAIIVEMLDNPDERLVYKCDEK